MDVNKQHKSEIVNKFSLLKKVWLTKSSVLSIELQELLQLVKDKI